MDPKLLIYRYSYAVYQLQIQAYDSRKVRFQSCITVSALLLNTIYTKWRLQILKFSMVNKLRQQVQKLKILSFSQNDAKRLNVIPGRHSETTHPSPNKTGDLLPGKATNQTVTPITNSTETDDNNTSNQSRNTTQSHLMDKTTHSFGVPLVVVFTLIIIIVLVILLVAFRTKIKTFCRNSQNQEHDIEKMDTTVSPLMIGK